MLWQLEVVCLLCLRSRIFPLTLKQLSDLQFFGGVVSPLQFTVVVNLLCCGTRLHIKHVQLVFLIRILRIMCLISHLRTDAMRLAADVTRLALEMLFVLTVVPKAQLALCEEIQLPSGEQQKGMR